MSALKRTLRYWGQIRREAEAFGLDPCLLAGLICQESAGNVFAERTEPDWKYHNLGLPHPPVLNKWTEWWGQARSYGLCQIMGTLARRLGFSGWWAQLFEVDTNLYYGAKALAGCMFWAKGAGEWRGLTDPLRIGLLKYNGGIFKAYPEKVLEWRDLISGETGQAPVAEPQ